MHKSNLDKRVQEDRIDILVDNLPSSLLVTITVSIFMFLVAQGKVPSANTTIWISSVLFLSLLRAIHIYHLIKYKKNNYLSEEKSIVFGIFLSGLLLASSLFVILPHNDLATQALFFFLLASMISGASSVYATHFISFLAYTIPILFSFLYQSTILPDILSFLFFIGLAYYAILLISMFRVHKSVLQFFKTKYLNHDLTYNLSLAKEDLEQSNKDLELENTVRKETEKCLYDLANYDPLTGLFNRHMFKENLKQAVDLSNKSNTSLALLFLDLDNFKLINDTLGHAMGDKLLISASSRLQSLLNKHSTVARLGGDEFVILMNEIKEKDEASGLATQVIKLLEQPFSFDGHEMFIGTSIGISFYPNDTQDMQTLLSYADTAMYEAKNKGKNNYQFFSVKMHDDIQFRHDVETQLHHAIENNEFHLSYQPKIDIIKKEVIGAEAFLRWDNEKLKNISPSVFIPIAEESNLITEIGKWVIERVCQDISDLKAKGLSNLCISLNISSSQILHQNLPQLIKENLADLSLPPESLELEFTEDMFSKQTRKSSQVLQELNEMGIRLCIDDFGTGYSSLNHLRTLPIHTLKIDKSFTIGTPQNQSNCAITKIIISLAQNLNLSIVAEGVETLDQVRFLNENGCTVVQGYYFAKPLSIDAFSTYLNTDALEIKKITF